MSKFKNDRCPYCGVKLPKIPKAKTKCKSCNNYMYVRTIPITNQKKVVTEKEKNKINKDRHAWRKFQELKDWPALEGLNLDKAFTDIQKELKEQFGFNPPIADVLWRLYNELARANMNHPREQSSIYSTMAFFLEEEGKDPFKILQEARRSELRDLKEQGVSRVEIMTVGEGSSGVCASCKSLVRKTAHKNLTIEEALETMPIPNPNCTYKFEEEHYNFCRCSYSGRI